jgi:hypothetical protein
MQMNRLLAAMKFPDLASEFSWVPGAPPSQRFCFCGYGGIAQNYAAKNLEAAFHHFKLDLPVGAVFFAKSQARHRYQLATERNGAQRFPLLSNTSGLGKSAASSARVLGKR